MKLTPRTRGSCTSRSPTTLPGPTTRLHTPGGAPARAIASTIDHALAGTSSAGLKTTVQPYASAGATFHAGIAIGKFHGVMIPTTPSGSRSTSTSTPGRTLRMCSPATRSASPAKNRKICDARWTSPIASARGLPSSRASCSPSSSARAASSSPAVSKTVLRSMGVAAAHPGAASAAAATASSTCASSATANSPTTSDRSEGLRSMTVVAPSTQSPPIRFACTSRA